MIPYLRVYNFSGVAPSHAELSKFELAQLIELRLRGQRRDEWIRGRMAIRRTLIAYGRSGSEDVMAEADGAPRLSGIPECAVSLSHDENYFAVALAAGNSIRVGVDLCLRRHAARLGRIFQRLHVTGCKIDTVAQWAILECVLKLRRQNVSQLFDIPFRLQRRNDLIEVAGLGEPAWVHCKAYPRFVVAWVMERT